MEQKFKRGQQVSAVNYPFLKKMEVLKYVEDMVRVRYVTGSGGERKLESHDFFEDELQEYKEQKGIHIGNVNVY